MGAGTNRPRELGGIAMNLAVLTVVLLAGGSAFTVTRLLFDEWQARRPGKHGG